MEPNVPIIEVISVPNPALTQRPAEYKSWREDSLDMACQEVTDGRLYTCRAAESYRMYKNTLSDHVSGTVREGSDSCPSRYVTDGEEAELVNFFVRSANVGYAKTKEDVVVVVSCVAQSKDSPIVLLASAWYKSFRKWHLHLTLRTAEILSYTQYMFTDQDVIDKYLNLLIDRLSDNKLIDRQRSSVVMNLVCR